MATAPPRRTKLADAGAAPTTTEDQAVQADPIVVIPKPFTLTLDSGGTVAYTAGTQTMPMEHAMHWWSRVQGVTIFTQ